MIINGKKYITEKQMSSHCGFSIGWLRKTRYAHKGLPYHVLNKKIYYAIEEVNEWFEKNLISVKN